MTKGRTRGEEATRLVPMRSATAEENTEKLPVVMPDLPAGMGAPQAAAACDSRRPGQRHGEGPCVNRHASSWQKAGWQGVPGSDAMTLRPPLSDLAHHEAASESSSICMALFCCACSRETTSQRPGRAKLVAPCTVLRPAAFPQCLLLADLLSARCRRSRRKVGPAPLACATGPSLPQLVQLSCRPGPCAPASAASESLEPECDDHARES